MKTFHRFAFLLLVLPATLVQGAPIVLWNESGMGDLSNFSGSPDDVAGTSPTDLGLLTSEPGGGLRQYRVSGLTQMSTGDFFTIEIGPGNQLQSILLQEFNYVSPTVDQQFFMAISSGDTFTVGYDQLNAPGFPFTTSDLSGWLGGSSISQAFVGTNILPQLSTINLGQPGFTPPLGPGQYTFLVQQTGTPNTYVLDFGVVGVSAIPEPSTSLAMAGLGVAAWWKRRRQRRR